MLVIDVVSTLYHYYLAIKEEKGLLRKFGEPYVEYVGEGVIVVLVYWGNG